MKKLVSFIALLLLISNLMFAQVSINTDNSAPNNSAMLDVKSSSKGFLPPRMTQADRNAIASPATGLMIFQTDNTPGYYNYNGTAWVALISAGGYTHYVGELFGGGIVAAVWKENNVEHCLICSLADMKTSGDVYTMAYSGNTNTFIGTAGSAVDGQANTNAIIAQSGGGNTPDRAATVCDAYTYTDATGTYSDWYLPAIWELNQCYNSSFIINTILGSETGLQFYVGSNYWSSTEYTKNYAWCYYFNNGATYYYFKYDVYRVRAVRRI